MTDYGATVEYGGLNDQVNVDTLVDEISLDRGEIQWRKDLVNFDERDVARLEALEPLFEANA